MKKIIVKSTDNYELDVHLFEVKNPKAIIQIIHGMEEHQKRYEELASILNKNGFTAVTSDMRGHGESAEYLGYFKEKYGWEALIEDQKNITKTIKNLYHDIPIYIFAHSMGSIIARNVLMEASSKYEKVILTGYPNYRWEAAIGIHVANLIIKVKGPKYRSPFLKHMSTGVYNKKVKNAKTNSDWISSNEKAIELYRNDPLCGFGFTTEAYRDLFVLVKRLKNLKLYTNVNENLQILLLSGLLDSCTGFEKGRTDSKKRLLKAGFTKIKSIEYPGYRHSIIDEKNNEKVFTDIIQFFDK